MAYRLVVFDLDGTLLDTLGDLAFSTNEALAQNGMPGRTLEEVRRFVGSGIATLIERATPPGTDPATIASVIEDFKRSYAIHAADTTQPYPGTHELLDALRARDIRCALVSNKADFAVQDLVERYFPGRFDVVLGERPDIARKPARDMVDYVRAQLDVPMGDLVYVGDSEVDYETAAACGCDLILCSWGFRSEHELRGLGSPTIVGTPEELLARICA